MNMWPRWIRIGNIALLLAALLPIWPYGYYTLLKIITCVVSALLAYAAIKSNKKGWGIVWGVVAFVYNPLIPLHLGRELWIIVNLVTIVLMGGSFKAIKTEEIRDVVQ